MSILELQKAVTQLPDDEAWSFAEWIEEYKADLWDKRIEADAKAGKLDGLFDEGWSEIRAGLSKPI